MIQTPVIYPIYCVESLGRYSLSGAHPFYSQTYFRLVIAEQDFVQCEVVNILVLEYQYKGTFWMIQLSFVYPMPYVQTLGWHDWSGSHLFLQQNVPLVSNFRARLLVFSAPCWALFTVYDQHLSTKSNRRCMNGSFIQRTITQETTTVRVYDLQTSLATQCLFSW